MLEVIDFDPEYEQPSDKDPLLSSVRGRWRMPGALTEDDFLRAFIAVDPRLNLAEVLARLRAGSWRTPSAFARYFRKPASWAMSFKFFLKRAGYIANHDEFYNLFPARKPKP